MSLGFEDCKVYISNVDCQTSSEGGIIVQVIGELSNRGGRWRKFVQTFFLAEQRAGFFVLNDVRRFIKDGEDEEEEEEEPVKVEESLINPAAPLSIESMVLELKASNGGPPVEVVDHAIAMVSPPAEVEEVEQVEKEIIAEPVVVAEPEPVVAEETVVVEVEPVVVPSPVFAAAAPVIDSTPIEIIASPSPSIPADLPPIVAEVPVPTSPVPASVARPITPVNTEPAQPDVVTPVASSSKLPEISSSPAVVIAEPISSPPAAPIEVVSALASPPSAPAASGLKSWAALAAANSVKWGSKAVNSKGVLSAAPPPIAAAPSASTASPRNPYAPAVQAVTISSCFIKGVVETISEVALRQTLVARFGPAKEFGVIRNKACGFIEFEKLDSARRAIQTSLRMGDGGEGGILIPRSDGGNDLVHVLTRKPQVDNRPVIAPVRLGNNQNQGQRQASTSSSVGGGNNRANGVANGSIPVGVNNKSNGPISPSAATTVTPTANGGGADDLVVVVSKAGKKKSKAAKAAAAAALGAGNKVV